MMKRLAGALLCLICVSAPIAASANIADGVNAIRSRGCGGKPGIKIALRASKGLNEVAREWSRGGRLRQAIDQTDYRVINSASMRVEGTDKEDLILKTLEQGYCALILDPSFTEIGLYQRNRNIWVVVAIPFVAPTARDAGRVGQRVLDLVNAARAKARKCGSTSFPPVPPLIASQLLDRAALEHAQDMAKHDLFEHEGSDGSKPAERVSRIGYRWRTVGENIASGPGDAESVVQGWLSSPGHCSNIMSPQFTEMGIAYSVNAKSRGGIYWAQEFATPRQR